MNILIIIRRSNGDVLLSSPLVSALREKYSGAEIDLVIHPATASIAKSIPGIRKILPHPSDQKNNNKIKRLIDAIKFNKKLKKKYDVAISLTTTDSSVTTAIRAGKISISAVDQEMKKSWWKKKLLSHHYLTSDNQHTILNNLKALEALGYRENSLAKVVIKPSEGETLTRVRNKLSKILTEGDEFLIFHAPAQYEYKTYPTKKRTDLLKQLSKLNIPIILTGGNEIIDKKIKSTIPRCTNIYDWIGETTLDEYIALSELSSGYIGNDTLNMHIAAAHEKRIFAIFGPTLVAQWSPWSNHLGKNTTLNTPLQKYGNITIFQGDMACVSCGKAGCNDDHGKSECLDAIPPEAISREVKNWLTEKG